ncbi:MAG: General secretory pathway protein E [Candidatus Amesbacteria bacterium GW2011_GWB1_48_13]|uniref:General secretory pathway protein E n=1 Tax=Candidatus Amesbacteria bacterium GW2011_GWB1_48_13 TaxID=1618362 RepID=A0A0G1XMC9_9BACT|nr:MAG: General secretory pathway protein E [Candidatus Amesbacteria bacterium GW2011_GWB1_48_13]
MLPYDNPRLKQFLSDLEVIDTAKLEKAYDQAQKTKEPLGELLIEKDLISDEDLGKVLSDMLSVPLARLSQVSVPQDLLHIVPEVYSRKHRVICFGKDSAGLKLGMENPGDSDVISFIAKKAGEKIHPYLITTRDFDQAVSLYKKDLQASFDQLLVSQVNSASASPQSDVPVSKLVDMLIEYAYTNRASDIHIEPEKKISLVRFRIDGILHDVLQLPKNLHEQVVSKIKVSARLRTDERFSAQDGRMTASLPQEELDIRVSIVPIVNGEKVVMRLLSSRVRQFSLRDLGMSASNLKKVEVGFAKPYGMVLSTGPTGSGKTTTIYSILKIINTREVNIATIEDPVEYDIQNINQIQVNPKTNLTFASGLRAILRQDPNIIFVGEIRDQETADIAVNAAMTGHLVLSTLHTNDSATTLPRLIDMGIEPFLVASTVNVIIGQRLVRKICTKCRVSSDVPASELAHRLPPVLAKKYLTKETVRTYVGKGCPVCHHTGYSGRVGIFEVMQITDSVRKLITAKADASEIIKAAVQDGMLTMLEDGVTKILSGETTLDEVLRATAE